MDQPTYNGGKSFEDIVKDSQAQMPQAIRDAHGHTINNRQEIEASAICGCFYCLHTFKPAEIVEWIKSIKDEFPTCPYCGIDSVLGDASGYPISKDFLTEMNKHWFDGDIVLIEDKPTD